MGCGWTPDPAADMSLLNAVEAVNGGSQIPGFSGIPFWEHQLDLGYRLTAIGGSDNHRPMTPIDQPGSIGRPTTVVYATELSTPAILSGLRAGHVFVDLMGTSDRILEVTAKEDAAVAHMGDELSAPAGTQVSFDVRIAGVSEGQVVLLQDGKPFGDAAPVALPASGQVAHKSWTSDGHRHWFRADVVAPDKKLLLLGNPIYANWEQGR